MCDILMENKKHTMKKSLRAVVRYASEYWLLTAAILGTATGLILDFVRQPLIASWTLASITVIAALVLLVRMGGAIRDGSYSINALGIISLITSLVLGQFWVGIALTIVLTLIDLINNVVMRYARREVRELQLHAPTTAHVLHKNKVLDTSHSNLSVRTVIVIEAGEIIPADATITEGSSSFDESILTGEHTAQTRGVGDVILCGSTNRGGTVCAEVLRVATDSQYHQTVRLAEAAAEHVAPFAHLAEVYSLPFTVAALTIGGVAWILSHDPIRFLDVLAVATPAPLILATPITVAAGLSRALRDGVVIKTGKVLERLAEARTVVFAKAGVLTVGAPVITGVVAFNPFAKDGVLGLAAAAEQSVRNSLARAIIAEAAAHSIKLAKARHVREIAGRGVEAHIKSADVLVGSLALMKERGVILPRQLDTRRTQTAAAYVAINGRLAGYLVIRDVERPEAKSALQALRRFGVRHMAVLTGDQQIAAAAIAKPLGISEVAAEKLPGEKLVAMEQFTPRPAVFVSNAAEDAPLLMAADIGIALGTWGDTAASGSADVLIMRHDLALVARTVAAARHTLRVATENILSGLILDIALMALFATGRFSALIGAGAQGLLAALVLISALRARTVASPTRR